MTFESRSQAGQDRFVYEVTGHKPNGTFLDVGCNHPTAVNNTWALEQQGWKGLLTDLAPAECGYGMRKSQFLKADATHINWLFQFRRYGLPSLVDYLSLDVDEATEVALRKFPLDKISFNVITVEHDSYRLGPKPRDAIRGMLKRAGYDLVCEDVMVNYPEGETNAFEDWWVAPSLSKNANWFRSKRKLWKDILAQAEGEAQVQCSSSPIPGPINKPSKS